jgi:hypothetical protein
MDRDKNRDRDGNRDKDRDTYPYKGVRFRPL